MSQTTTAGESDSARGSTNGDFESTIAGLLPNSVETATPPRSQPSSQSPVWPHGLNSGSTGDSLGPQSFNPGAAEGQKASSTQVTTGFSAAPSAASSDTPPTAAPSVPSENGPSILPGANSLLWSLLLASSRAPIMTAAPAEGVGSAAIQDARVVGQQNPLLAASDSVRGTATSKQPQPAEVTKTKSEPTDQSNGAANVQGVGTIPFPLSNSSPFAVPSIVFPADSLSLPLQAPQFANKPEQNTASVASASATSAVALQSGVGILQAAKPTSPTDRMPEFFSFGLELTPLLSASSRANDLTPAARAVLASLVSRSAGPASTIPTSTTIAAQSGGEPKLVNSATLTSKDSGALPGVLGSASASTVNTAQFGTSAEQKPTAPMDAIAEQSAPAGGKTSLKAPDSSHNFAEHASSFPLLNAATGIAGFSVAAELGRPSQSNSVSSSTLPQHAPETSGDTAKEVLVRLESATGETISIRVFDRAGQVQVQVRSSDPLTAQHLRSDLSTLTTNLETAGWKANVSLATPDLSTTRAAASSSPDQSSSDSTPDKRSLTWDDQNSNNKGNTVADLWEELLKRGST